MSPKTRCGWLTTALAGMLLLQGCINNPLAADRDGDGVMAGFDEDCDDQDTELGAKAFDADCDGVLTVDDCDDDNFLLLAIADDADCDGVTEGEDCDDQDPDRYPENVEDACDGFDSDCVPDADEIDDDGDGQMECEGDCDDADSMNSGIGAETCDGQDNDCNGLDDAGSPGIGGQESDDDGDGQAECQGDCDDTDAATFEGSEEICDGQDNDCNGLDDAGAAGEPGQESDNDADGQAVCEGDCDDSDPTNWAGNSDAACDGSNTDCIDDPLEVDDDGDGMLDCEGDCDDQDPLNFDGNAETCDGQDNDCNGLDDATLPGVDGLETDDDGDGQAECEGDCDDLDPLNFDGNTEDCDGQDNDCNGLDDSGAAGVSGQESDGDGDGQSVCQGDCDDTDALNFAGNVDSACDGLDTNCVYDTGEVDDDGDGQFECQGDCDDANALNFLGNAEACDGQDNDCNGLDDAGIVGLGGQEADDDGDGQWECQGDCDDTNPLVFDGNSESCDGLDNNCDGALGPAEVDDDSDGVTECDGDCNDGNSSIYPGNCQDAEGDSVDSNCDGFDSFALSGAQSAFTGEIATDESGHAVAGAGDVNGDGFQDLLIGAWSNDEGGAYAGKSYLILGSTSMSMAGPASLSSAYATFIGEASGDTSGRTVAAAGDVDGDGLADLLIGADGNGQGGPGAGKSYLFLGSTIAGGGTFNLVNADASFVGESANDRAYSISTTGDVDGDGLDDVLIGASGNDDAGLGAGKSYLFFASTIIAGGTFDLSTADASFLGESAEDSSGFSVAGVGDVDGDGLDDLLIGAWSYWVQPWGQNSGKTYLLFGSTISGGGSFSLFNADATFTGENQQDASGLAVSGAGDVDGDGLADILIGAPGSSQGGKSYLFFGDTVAAGGAFSLATADASFQGESSSDSSGRSLASAGDVDGDGLDDVLVGALWNDEGGTEAGKSYLFLGSSVSGGGVFNLATADAAFVGEAGGDFSGESVSAAGDVDGDGLDDLLIGASRNDEAGSNAGKSYLLTCTF